MKIILAIDGSTFSDAAIEEVARRPWPTGSEVKVLTVTVTPAMPAIHPWYVPPTYYVDVEKALHENAEAPIQGAMLKLKTNESRSLKVTSEIIQGSPREVILDEAARWGADLIVMGSHGYGDWSRFLLGSVSQSVVTHAKCSVEIVKRSEMVVEGEKK
jgi:nucleotide-binding universal stress UspA family protein